MNFISSYRPFVFLLLVAGLLSSCSRFSSSPPERLAPPEPVLIKEDVSKEEAKEEVKGEELQPLEEPSAVPQEEWLKTQGDGVYRLGKPYKVNGVWYFPAENPRYDEIGYASWYGAEFHNKRTANGEIFDKNRLTGAHKTLPLPSVVRVTNIENNKSVVLRVNDRGPFTSDRLIDVSERAAKLLEFPNKGVTRVRVEILPEESKVAIQQTSRRGQAEAVSLPEKKTQMVEKLSQPQGKDAIIIPEATPEEASSTEEVKETVSLFDAPVMMPAEVSELAPVAPAATGTPIYIQVGIFRKQENAENTVQKVSSIGPTKSWLSDVGGKVLYRVQVGPFDTVGDAEKALTQVKEQGLPDAYIMKNQG
jgi:rare lipoprotein A